MNAPKLMKPTMNGGDAPPCVKNWPEGGGGDDELLVGDAVAVVVPVSRDGCDGVGVGMIMDGHGRAYCREAVRIVRCAWREGG